MSRSAQEKLDWKPRRLRKQDAQARGAHLQKSLPQVVRDVFAGDESRVEAVPPEPAEQPKKSKFAGLLWEPREGGGG